MELDPNLETTFSSMSDTSDDCEIMHKHHKNDNTLLSPTIESNNNQSWTKEENQNLIAMVQKQLPDIDNESHLLRTSQINWLKVSVNVC